MSADGYHDPARKAWPLLAIFVLVGLGFMTPFVLQAIRDIRIATVYQQTECEIINERTVASSSSSTLGGRWVETRYSHTEFTWSYIIDGRRYTAAGYDNHDGVMADPQETGAISKGTSHACWYDPAAPEKSVLVRHFYGRFYLGALIPGSFVFVGGLLLRGVRRRKPMPVEARVSKGGHLRYRLSPVLSTRGLLGCLGVIVLVLGLGIVLVLPHVGDGGSSLSSDKAWLYLISLGIEGFLIYHLVRAARAARVPDPLVEINDEPLRPGQTTQLYIRHPGPAQVALLQVQIVCEKVGQGGTRVAHKQLVLERTALHIAAAEEFNETFSVPVKAAPSLKTVQTATNWCVRIRRKLDTKTSYDTDYPFRVVGPDSGGVLESDSK